MKNLLRYLIAMVALCIMTTNISLADDGPSKEGNPFGMRAEVFSFEISKNKLLIKSLSKKTKLEATARAIYMQLLVNSPQKIIIGMDECASKIIRFRDDQGTDILKKATKSFHISGVSRTLNPIKFSGIYDQGHQCIIDIGFYNCIPTPKARELYLDTNLVFNCADPGTITEERKWTFSKGDSFTLDGKTIKVSGKHEKISCLLPPSLQTAQEKQETVEPLEQHFVTLTSEFPLVFIKSIHFFGPDGKEIPHSVANQSSDLSSLEIPPFKSTKDINKSSSVPSPPVSQTHDEITYELDKKVDILTAKIVYYKNTEKVTLPVSLKFGVGF